MFGNVLTNVMGPYCKMLYIILDYFCLYLTIISNNIMQKSFEFIKMIWNFLTPANASWI